MIVLQWLVVIFAVFVLSCGNQINSQCGQKPVSRSFISNGNVVSENVWPWLASIFSKSEVHEQNGNFLCGATLVSLKSVLTAANCIHSKHTEKMLSASEFEVRLGRQDLTDSEDKAEFTKVLEPIIIIAMHPDWDPLDNSNHRYDADLALLIAGKDIEPSSFIAPICLPNRDNLNAIGTVVGWGTLGSNGENILENIEDRSRQVQVKRVSQEDCFYENSKLAKFSSSRTFCITEVEKEENPCKGDSGGGFFANSEGTWYIEGIVSGAMSGICPNSTLSLLTKLSVFTNWIEQGINNFYTVQFTQDFDEGYFTRYYDLQIPEVLHQGAFLSMVNISVNFKARILNFRRQDLRHLPNNIGYVFPNLERFRANTLNITSIERTNFKNMDYLFQLDLSDNLIEQIPSDCFDDLVSLIKFSISENKLKVIHANTFAKNLRLMTINMWDNQIEPTDLKNLKSKRVKFLLLARNRFKSIPSDAFDGLENLGEIDLEENELTALHEDIFLNNPQLTLINANANSILCLPEGLFRNNSNLEQVEFENNNITEISTVFQSQAKYDFRKNICINKHFVAKNLEDLNAMNAELRELCGKK